MNGSKGLKWSILLSFVVMLGVGNMLASEGTDAGGKKEEIKTVEASTKVTQNFMVRFVASVVATLRRPVDWSVGGVKWGVGGTGKIVGKTFGKLMDIVRWFGSKLPFGKKLFGVVKEDLEKKKSNEDDSLKNAAGEKKEDEVETNLKKELKEEKEEDSQTDEDSAVNTEEGEPA